MYAVILVVSFFNLDICRCSEAFPVLKIVTPIVEWEDFSIERKGIDHFIFAALPLVEASSKKYHLGYAKGSFEFFLFPFSPSVFKLDTLHVSGDCQMGRSREISFFT